MRLYVHIKPRMFDMAPFSLPFLIPFTICACLTPNSLFNTFARAKESNICTPKSYGLERGMKREVDLFGPVAMPTRQLKTKKAASKRFIKTGKGGLKRGKAFKGHLTSKKSPERKRRLNVKTHLVGATLKKMRSLLLTGK